MYEEDIFSASNNQEISRKLIIRYSDIDAKHFNKSSKVKWEQIQATLSQGEWPICVSKREKDEFLISVYIKELDGQVDLVVTYPDNGFYYDLLVSYENKTKFRSSTSFPHPDYCLAIKATFVFIGPNSPMIRDFAALGGMEELKRQVDSLQVAPAMSIEQQHDIWTCYIEAQKQIIDALNKPFELSRPPEITPEMRQDGKGIGRYRLDLYLPANDHNEYTPLKQALEREVHIDASFDNDGTSFLTLDDINRGLDAVIKREFPERFERCKEMTCILKVYPISKAEQLSASRPDLAHFFQIQGDDTVFAEYLKAPVPVLMKEMATLGLYPFRVNTTYRIKGVDNLYQSPHVEKFGITFSNEGRFLSNFSTKEILLPEPINANTFRVDIPYREDFESRFILFERTIEHIYGKENIQKEIAFRFRNSEEGEIPSVPGFTKEQWDDIWKDLYAIDTRSRIAIGDTPDGKTIGFEFETKEELSAIYDQIAAIKKFRIARSPLESDFRFKVKTILTAKKTEKEIFDEKLKKLGGTDFVYDFIDSEDERHHITSIFMGRLSSRESSSDHLVLYLPNIYPDEQKKAAFFLKFFDNRREEIDSVHANLIGDIKKIEWLKDAIAKMGATERIQGPNDVPVNVNIRDFIFDTSKAQSSIKWENTPVEFSKDFKDFDKTAILNLNDEQKKAVIKAVTATDLCMLQGPPGTGKTTVIAELIWQEIRLNQKKHLLLTSETNLAVDNALEKLMNDRAVNPDMARYVTLIKPLRFGRAEKFEEEGKRYSIDRIERWIDNAAVREEEYDSEVLEDNMDGIEEEEPQIENLDDNIVQIWMKRIADRSLAGDPRYAEVLKDWVIGLAMPDKETKVVFRGLYYDNVNIVGSTCSSTGSPAFLTEYLKSIKHLDTDTAKAVVIALRRWKRGRLSGEGLTSLGQLLGLGDDLDPCYEDIDPEDEFTQEVKKACTIKFDTVIMDEASKATPPELLMPLCFGQKSIVIGDHRQLPPMLYEKSFREALRDLDTPKAMAIAEVIDRDFVNTSQFKRMILNPKVSPTIKSTFNTQYRMHPDINAVINQFYLKDECGGLRCGLDTPDDKDLNNPQSRYHGFMSKGFISPDVHTIWVDVKAPELTDGSSKVNDEEVRAINTVIERLSKADGFKEYMAHWDTLKEDYKRNEEKEIGVISFYGKQTGRIIKTVKPYAKSHNIRVKINTVDKFQGMERNIVIVSTVRSNIAFNEKGQRYNNTDAGFADSPERLNVALSRARRLLIVVGNKDFFANIKDKEGNPLYLNVIQEIEKRGRIIPYNELIKSHE